MARVLRKKLISVVIPIFDEESNIDELYIQLVKLMSREEKYSFEIIAVEHGSTDSTFKKLLTVNKKDKRLKILQLSRNFGNADAAIFAGLNFVKGDACVLMMGDLQDPPDMIPQFIRKWEQGYEIVYGIIKKRADTSFSRKISSLLFYMILNKLTDNLFPENVSDFRLIDKKVYEIVKTMPERNKFLRGIINWTGFSQIGVSFNREKRFAGESKAYFFTVLKVALNGIFSFSYAPLKLVTLLGFALSVVSFMLIIYQLSLYIVVGRGEPGISTIVVVLGFLFGMLFLILGVIGEYLARIYDEVKQRPNFIIRNKIGL